MSHACHEASIGGMLIALLAVLGVDLIVIVVFLSLVVLTRRRFGYWRAMAIRVSASVSTMRSPERSTVMLYRVPVNRNGAW
jgi:uncharacterized iron-regulated membrane protein